MDAETATYWLGWIRPIQLVAVFLVAVGVAAEFVGEWVGRPLEKIVEDARELHVAELTKDAKRLSSEAEAAKAAIAEANARAESERLERVKLEAKIAPRRLSGEQKEAFVAALSGVPRVPPTVAVVSRLMDAEGETSRMIFPQHSPPQVGSQSDTVIGRCYKKDCLLRRQKGQ